jgi:hypothetical protein
LLPGVFGQVFFEKVCDKVLKTQTLPGFSIKPLLKRLATLSVLN